MGCMPWGPPRGALTPFGWQEAHSTSGPEWPCTSMLWMLSLAWDEGNSACVEPWHEEHCSPPCPAENR